MLRSQFPFSRFASQRLHASIQADSSIFSGCCLCERARFLSSIKFDKKEETVLLGVMASKDWRFPIEPKKKKMVLNKFSTLKSPSLLAPFLES